MVVLLSGQGDASTIAEYVPPSDFPLFGFSRDSYRPGQAFTPTESGQLAEISVLLASNGEPPISVYVELRPTLAGVPTSTVLATATVAVGNLLSPTPTLFSADFEPFDLNLAAGTVYAFTLRTSIDGGATAIGDLDNGYLGGDAYVSNDSGTSWEYQSGSSRYDIGFTVTTIPEPTSFALAAFGFLGLAIAGWRSRNRRTGKKGFRLAMIPEPSSLALACLISPASLPGACDATGVAVRVADLLASIWLSSAADASAVTMIWHRVDNTGNARSPRGVD